MKTKTFYVYMLVFCCSVFSFATVILPRPMSVNEWLTTLSMWAAVGSVAACLISDNRQTKPIADLISLVYLFLLLARRINSMNTYMKIYHRQTSAAGNILITALTVIMITGYSNIKMEKLSAPVCTAVIFMLVMAVLLNFSKANPINLYRNFNTDMTGYLGVTLFDYIIPANIILNSSAQADRKKSVSAIFITTFVLITITVYIFSCVKGDLLYSISPLQMVFQISAGMQISNFDAYYNFLVGFSYFAVVMLIIHAYNSIKSRFSYFSRLDLLVIFPACFIVRRIDDRLWLPAMLVIAIVLVTGRKKAGYYEKV